MKKEMIQTRNRKMNKKMIIKHETVEEDWTNNDWLKSYNLMRANEIQANESKEEEESAIENASIGETEEDIEDFEKSTEDENLHNSDMIEIEENDVLS